MNYVASVKLLLHVMCFVMFADEYSLMQFVCWPMSRIWHDGMYHSKLVSLMMKVKMSVPLTHVTICSQYIYILMYRFCAHISLYVDTNVKLKKYLRVCMQPASHSKSCQIVGEALFALFTFFQFSHI